MTHSAALTPNEQQPHVDAAVVGQVRTLCMSLPGTSEKQAWGDPSFRAGGRMYAILKFGGGRTDLWMAAPAGAQEALTGNNPSRFFKPSNHPLHDGWIGLHLQAPAAIDWDEVEFLLAQAHVVAGGQAAGQPRGDRS